MDFRLTPEQEQFKKALRAHCEKNIAPYLAGDRREGRRHPRRDHQGPGGHGRLQADPSRGVRRPGAGRGDDLRQHRHPGDRPGRDEHVGARLRAALPGLGLPYRPLRDQAVEGRGAAQGGVGRVLRRHLHHRAAGRLGHRRHQDLGGAARTATSSSTARRPTSAACGRRTSSATAATSPWCAPTPAGRPQGLHLPLHPGPAARHQLHHLQGHGPHGALHRRLHLQGRQGARVLRAR